MALPIEDYALIGDCKIAATLPHNRAFHMRPTIPTRLADKFAENLCLPTQRRPRPKIFNVDGMENCQLTELAPVNSAIFLICATAVSAPVVFVSRSQVASLSSPTGVSAVSI